jgi:DNA-binding LacI/PurR family transcriptional regulator
MARTKLDATRRKILDDIVANFDIGGRYRPVREIADAFSVSLQTAQHAVSILLSEGYLYSEPKRGLYVRKKIDSIDLKGKRIIVSSSMFDPRFTEAFLSAIKQVSDPLGVEVALVQDEDKDSNTIQHGERLIRVYREHEAEGLIALAYRNVELAFYHALNAGCQIISDVCFPNLPMLPAVQTDNHKHSEEAAATFAELGKKEIMIIGYWAKNNVRYNSFDKEFRRLVKNGSTQYVFLGDATSTANVYIFLRQFTSPKGIFAIDYAANHTVAAYLASYGIPPKDNFMVYDSESDYFIHPGLEPVQSAAPGLNVLGRRLAERLIQRMKDRVWSLPLQELI